MRIYIVQKDDTLYKIAKKHQVQVEEIIKLNPQIANPEYIVAGMKIKLPNEADYDRNQEEILEKQHKEKELNARTNERPLGSVKDMDDRGAWDTHNRIPLKKREQSFQGSHTKPIKHKQTDHDHYKHKTNKQVKSYSNRQYIPLHENVSKQKQPHQHTTTPYANKRHTDRLFTNQEQNAYKRPHAPNRPYTDGRRQMDQHHMHHLHHGSMMPPAHHEAPHFCPCCAYHWHMQQSMMQHYNNNDQPQQVKQAPQQGIYY